MFYIECIFLFYFFCYNVVRFIFQMNLQLIFWIGLISSICYVFGQAGKKKKKKLPSCLFMSVSCIGFLTS